MNLVMRSVLHVLAGVLRHVFHFLLALLVLLVIALSVLLTTQTGRAWTAQVGIVVANQFSDWYIQAHDLRSPGLTEWEVGQLRVYPPGVDQSAVTVDELAVSFPFNQWEMAFTVTALTADRVTVDIDRFRAMERTERDDDDDLMEQLEEMPPDPAFGFWLEHLAIGDFRLLDSQGSPLTGAVVGSLAWPGGGSLPVFDLTWGDEASPMLDISGQPDDSGDGWLLGGDVSLPTDTWAHDLTQWPGDEPLNASVSLTANLQAQEFSLHELSLPWQGHSVSLRGDIGFSDPGWYLNDGELTVDDRVSTLSGRFAPDDSRIDGDLDLPLTLVANFLPEALEDNSIRPGDNLRATLSWPQGERWQLDATANTHWYDQTVALNLNAQGLDLDIEEVTANLALGNSELAASGHWHLNDHDGRIAVRGDIAADVAEPFWSDSLFQGGTIDGELRGMGRDSTGDILFPQWEGRVNAQGEAVTDTTLAAIPWQAEADTTLQFPDVNWQNLTLSLDVSGQDAGLVSQGSYDLEANELSAQWQLDELPISPIAQSLVEWPDGLTMALTGDGEISGALDNLNGQLRLDGDGQWQGQPWQASVRAPIVSTQQILVESITGQWRDSRLNANLSIRPDLNEDWSTWPVQADITPVELSLADAGELVEEWPETLTDGEVVTSVSVRGRLGDPDIMAQSRLNAEYLGETLTGSFNWQADSVQADINWQDRAVTLEGRGRPWENGAWTLSARRIQTEDLAPWVDLPGQLEDTQLSHNLTVNVDGNMQDARVQVVSDHAGSWDAQALTAASEASLTLVDGGLERWQLDLFDVAWSDARLSAEARSQENAWLPESFDLAVDAFPVHLFAPIPDLEALVSGQASLDANWPEWDVELDLQLSGSQGDEALEGDLTGLIQGSEETLLLVDLQSLDITLGDTMAVSGSGGLSDDRWNLELDWTGVSWVPPDGLPVPGELWEGDGSIRLSGVGDDPDIDMQTDWVTEWVAADSDEQLDLTFSAQLKTTSDELTFTSGLRRPGKDLLLIGADTPRMAIGERLEQPWDEWDIAAFWEIDFDTDEILYWLGQEQVQIGGIIQGEGTVSGDLGTPDLQGSLRWEDGELRIPQASTEFDQIQLELSADDAQALTVSGSARAGNGSIDLGGDLRLEDGELISDATLNLDRAVVVQRADVQSLASGELTLTGTWPDMLLAGDLRLIDLNVNINRLAGPSVPQLEIHDERNGGGLNGGGGDIPLAIDVGIRTEGNATIRGNGIDARLSGELRLGGTLAQLESDGALTIESGTFNLLTRRFELQEGQVRIVDEAIDIYLVAVHQTREVMVEATVRGNAEQLQLTLRSEPSLPQDEIVAQLLFGKTVQNMTPWQALQLANAINQLSGGDSIDLFTSTRETLGLDTLEVDAPEEDGEAVTLRVGRYLNSRVYLELDTDLDEDRAWAGSVEVELTPNLSLETFTGSGGSSGGLELRWRRDY